MMGPLNVSGHWPILHSNACTFHNCKGSFEILMGPLEILMGRIIIYMHGHINVFR